MKANESLSKIPVYTAGKIGRADKLIWLRKSSKSIAILVIILLPILGIFRIDVSSGFVVLDRQIWFSDFNLVFGLWLALACTFILFYSTVGTAFCGWVCPQNTFSNIMDSITKRLLGKRAAIDWEEKSSKVAAKKNTALNWAQLSIETLLLSMLVSIIPIIYFIPPAAIWSFVTLQPHPMISGSIYWIYAVFVFISIVNLAVVRHYFCRYMCVYRMWQFLFRTTDSLHLDYDETRKADCEKCNYCVTSCMVDIDPRDTSTFDSCTNCGACISACDSIHTKEDEKGGAGRGLLSFRFGKRRKKENLAQRSIATLKNRVGWVLPVWALGMALFVWGLVDYNPYHLAVYKSEKDQGEQIDEYRVHLANKVYEEGFLKISVSGLAANEYTLTDSSVTLAEAGRYDAYINISNQLKPGLYSFVVIAESRDGWKSEARIQHFVNNG